MKYIQKQSLFLLSLLFTLTACSQFSDDTNPYDVSEQMKNLSGQWKIAAVSRNGTDITKSMDFSHFALTLNADGTYQISNYLPFVVRHDGTWSADDMRYPFQLTFVPDGTSVNRLTSDNATTVAINAPILQGQRVMTIQLSPGCTGNTYIYTLQRNQ